MLVAIEYDNERGYTEGLEMIEHAKKYIMEKQEIDERVLASLGELKEFWSSATLYFAYGTDCNSILAGALDYFSNRRKNIKFSDWNKIYQKLIVDLKENIISANDMEIINRIRNSKYLEDVDVFADEITAEEFFERIDCKILSLALEAKYESANNDKEIQMYEFVRNKVNEFGVSDSYVVQFLYKKLWERLEIASEVSEKDKLELARTLEIYRCAVNESVDSKNELMKKYTFSI
ncbi:MAG: hypothetical protein J6A59_09775 [Lachnospiraceae bacterium]|nr:hypothetical protein [Lachnospiraceae bacterium]